MLSQIHFPDFEVYPHKCTIIKLILLASYTKSLLSPYQDDLRCLNFDMIQKKSKTTIETTGT